MHFSLFSVATHIHELSPSIHLSSLRNFLFLLASRRGPLSLGDSTCITSFSC